MKSQAENVQERTKVHETPEYGEALFSVIPGIERVKHVPVLQAGELKEDVFRNEWVSNNSPCLVKGAVSHWPAVEKFKAKDYWLSLYNTFEIAVYPHMNYMDEQRQEINKHQMVFRDAVERLFEDTDRISSIPSQPIFENNDFAPLIKEMPGFSFLANPEMPKGYFQRRFFMQRKASTGWHYHAMDETLMCQVNGSKKVVLLPPKIASAKNTEDVLKSDRYMEGKKLDKTLDLKPVIAYVEEGDALYIPPYWYHAVVPTDREVGFTLAFCWGSPWHKFGDFFNFYVRKFYKDHFWPFTKISLLLPLVACYAGPLYAIRKVKLLFKGKSKRLG